MQNLDKMLLRVCFLLCAVGWSVSQNHNNLNEVVQNLMDEVNRLRQEIQDLTNHQLSQDLYAAEKTRSDGQSGVKLVRLFHGGTRPYYLSSHAASRMLGMHNHANFERVIGLGEMTAVLNGAEFKTRHNDYSMRRPSTTSDMFHLTEEIEYPEVPQAVLDQNTINEQIAEMREWFKAWHDQDYSVRDYRQYFKPVLCYLEGAWFYPDQIHVDQSPSDRHFINSPDFVHLQKQYKYTADSGRKDDMENMAYLPRMVYRVENGTAEYAQWNYRILCHPQSEDLPTNRFRPIDNLAVRMRYNIRHSDFEDSMKVRFQLNPEDRDQWASDQNTRFELIDKLMGEVPGLNNYGARIEDDGFDSMAYRADQGVTTVEDGLETLNAAYYHRWFRAAKRGAMGHSFRHRGFNDNNLFVAVTTQQEVVPTEVEHCEGNKHKTCTTYSQRFSYAIPLEIIYMTPMTKWNPYDILYKGRASTDEGKTVRADGRNGRPQPEKAFNGTNHNTYYRTPNEFFTGGEVATDPADTTRSDAIAVLDSQGNMRMVRDSGHRIFFPDIPGVGSPRQRYPVMPVYGEGNTLWKEVEALKDVILDSDRHRHMYRQHSVPSVTDPDGGSTDGTNNVQEGEGALERPRGMVLELAAGTTGHTHLVELSGLDVADLNEGRIVTVTSDVADGHDHQVQLEMKAPANPNRPPRYVYKTITPSEPHAKRLNVVQGVERDYGVE